MTIRISLVNVRIFSQSFNHLMTDRKMQIVAACLCLLVSTISAANAEDMCGQFQKEYSFSTIGELRELLNSDQILREYFLNTASSAIGYTTSTTLTSEPRASTVRNELSTPGTTTPTTVREPLPPPSDWISWNGTIYYKVYSEKKNYNDAENTCESHGARLAAVIVRDATDELFPRLEENKNYWIGLQDRVEEDVFLWSDNYTYLKAKTPWNDNEPNNYNNEDCVELRKNIRKLNDANCSRNIDFICERRQPEHVMRP